MSNKHIHPVLAEILDNISRPPRHVRQQDIEGQIMAFRPDADEAHEILAALLAAFERRYEKSSDVEHYAKYLSAAFTRVEHGFILNEPDECDLARDWRARKDG